jgi:3-deoxy-D-manno-octulosonic-acid transferase
MALVFYHIFLWLYAFALRIASWWNPKAAQWIRGRSRIFDKLESAMAGNQQPVAWFHCASLGEFEQGRPVMEKMRKEYPGLRILVSFFSPSGYEIKKNDPVADWVFYLPLDGRKNAARFLDIIKPALIVFIKYDYWYFYLSTIKKRNIPCLLVSAVFRKEQSFFSWYGGFQRKMLRCFTAIFVQNDRSKLLLEIIGIENVIVSGDTRFDRVNFIGANRKPLPLIEYFLEGRPCIVAGSTWSEDESMLAETLPLLVSYASCLIIAPHEVHTEKIKSILQKFPGAILFSQLKGEKKKSSILIIDNVGMLSSLYAYAKICYVGGGFSKDGIHNVLEAAVYAKPVLIGPNYKKYFEAGELIAGGGAFSFSQSNELVQILKNLWEDEPALDKACIAAGAYVSSHTGASTTIMNYIAEKRLLTRL